MPHSALCKKTLLRHICCAALMLALCLLPASALGEGVFRALFVACENFLSAESIAPSASNNVRLLAGAFAQAVSPETLSIENGTLASSGALGDAIQTAFSGANEADVSLFYLSTHGLYDPSRPDEPARLLLSDGTNEDFITADQLAAFLDPIPGTKLVILDACSSGAFIGKGMPDSVAQDMSLPLSKEGYKVVASCGGNEDSFFWSSGNRHRDTGSSYFALALSRGITPHGGYAADLNQDGQITFSELRDYLLQANGASAAQFYPEQSEDVVVQYEPVSSEDIPAPLISHFSLGSPVLTYDDPTLTFSFVAAQDVRISYQIVYHQQGRWMWESAQRILDDTESDDGFIYKGYKERTLSLAVDALSSDAAGYALLQLIVEGRHGPEVAQTRLLCVQPIIGNPQLSLHAPLSFVPGEGRELPIEAWHDFPVSLTLSVHAADGQRVRSLARAVPSRPTSLKPERSFFYWDGRDDEGSLVPPGQYALRLTTRVGERAYDAVFEYVYVRDADITEPVQPVG